MEVTRDYNIFNIIESNRAVGERHVAKLADKMKERDLMEDFPILVDNNMNIIDGQHRFFARKLLGLPVYYNVSNVATCKDIHNVNTVSKNWQAMDYLKYYILSGKVEYIKFKKFMDDYSLPSIGIAQKILGIYDTSDFRLGTNKYKFNSGKFTFPKDKKWVKIIGYITSLNNIVENSYHKSIVTVFCSSIAITKTYNHGRLMKKFSYTKFPVISTASQLKRDLNEIYNQREKEHNKIIFNGSKIK